MVLTQVGRALARLGIEHIAAYSPKGTGALGAAVPDVCRIGCAKELRLAGIRDVGSGQPVAEGVSGLADHNPAVCDRAGSRRGSAFVADRAQGLARQILCVVVGSGGGEDYTIAWGRPLVCSCPRAGSGRTSSRRGGRVHEDP